MSSTQSSSDERRRGGIGVFMLTAAAGTIATVGSVGMPQHMQGIAPEAAAFAIRATAGSANTSTIKVGVLRGGIASLISDQAKLAVGAAGLKRLQNFLSLPDAWDGPSSRPASLASIDAFSSFFASTGLQPLGLAVFLSPRGNVVTNWKDAKGQLVELEFDAHEGTSYFIEQTEDEGIAESDFALSQMLHEYVINASA
jgi:hypothetical protein